MREKSPPKTRNCRNTQFSNNTACPLAFILIKQINFTQKFFTLLNPISADQSKKSFFHSSFLADNTLDL